MPIDLAYLSSNPEAAAPKQRQANLVHPVGYKAIERIAGIDRPVEGTISIIDSRSGFELTMTDELFAGIREQGGLSALAPVFEALREDILDDPLGVYSVDRQKRSVNAQARIVQHVPEGHPLDNLIPGKHLVLKTTGNRAEAINARMKTEGIGARSRATEQFRTMLAFQQLQEQEAPDGFFGLMRVAKVYGTLREPKPADGNRAREWLLMEQVIANRQLENVSLVNNGRMASGFIPRDYPELGALVVDNPQTHTSAVPIDNLVEAIMKNYPTAIYYFGDFGHENLLEVLKPRNQAGIVEKEYVIIDAETL